MTKLSEINRARNAAGLPIIKEEPRDFTDPHVYKTVVDQTPAVPAEPIVEATAIDAAAVEAAAKAVIEMASLKAERANGEVDADGIDDFIDVCMREFATAVMAKAKELNVD